MKQITFLIQIIEGYRATFTEVYDNGVAVQLDNISESFEKEFLMKFKVKPPLNLAEKYYTFGQLEEYIKAGEEVLSEIRTTFQLPSDCSIFAFEDGVMGDLSINKN